MTDLHPNMNLEQRVLYHQIHPLKLFVDWSAGFIALYFAWRRELGITWAIALVPSVLVTIYLIRFADLQKYKDSRFGHYVAKYMGSNMEQIRLLGYAVMLIGAWIHAVWMIPAGLLVIVLAWSRGAIQERFQKSK